MPSSLGPAEILVILVIALVVLGPKRLPEAGRQVGRVLSEVRRWSRDVQGEIRSVIEPDPEPAMAPPAAEPRSVSLYPPPAVTAPTPATPASPASPDPAGEPPPPGPPAGEPSTP